MKIVCGKCGLLRHALLAAALTGLMAHAASPDGGVVQLTFTVCDASACGEDFLRARGVEEVSANLGLKPQAAPPEGSKPVKVSSGEAIHVTVGETRFIRLPCNVTRFALGNTPWDITSTGSRADFLLRGMFAGRAPLTAWCGDGTRRTFEVSVEAR